MVYHLFTFLKIVPHECDKVFQIILRTIVDRSNFSGSFAHCDTHRYCSKPGVVSWITERFSVRGKHLLLSARCAPLARQFFKAPSSSLSSRLHLTINDKHAQQGVGAINRSIIVRDGLDSVTMVKTKLLSPSLRVFSFQIKRFSFFFSFLPVSNVPRVYFQVSFVKTNHRQISIVRIIENLCRQ